MKIVFTSKGNNWDSEIDPRFGRADFLLLFDEQTGNLQANDNRDTENQAHGVGPKTVEKIYELGANVLITGNGPGNNAAMMLKRSGIKTYVGATNKTIKKAYDAFKKNELQEFQY